MKLYRQLPHMRMLQTCKPFSGSCHMYFLFAEYFKTVYRIDIEYEIFRRTFRSTTYYTSRILKHYRKLSDIMLQRESHFHGQCHMHFLFAEYFSILRIDIEYEIFVAFFSTTSIQQDLETLQEAFTHNTVAYKPFSWSCHIHFHFAEYF